MAWSNRSRSRRLGFLVAFLALAVVVGNTRSGTAAPPALEPGAVEFKYYAPGVGLVLITTKSERVELVDVISPTAQEDDDNQDEAGGYPVLLTVLDGRGNRFARSIFSEDPVADAGAVAQGYGAGRCTETAISY